MTRRLVVHPKASEELEHEIGYYEGERTGLGAELADDIALVYDALIDESARPVPIPGIPNALGVRRILLHRFPLAIILNDRPAAAYILAIAHVRRRPRYWLSRVRDATPAPRRR